MSVDPHQAITALVRAEAARTTIPTAASAPAPRAERPSEPTAAHQLTTTARPGLWRRIWPLTTQ